MTELIMQGIGVSGGIAVAPLFLLPEMEIGARDKKSPVEERRTLEEAVAEASASLTRLIEEVAGEAADILEFQAVLLEDDDLLKPIFEAISGGQSADDAWSEALNREIDNYRNAETEEDAFAARASDLADLRDRVLRAIAGFAKPDQVPDVPSIILAKDLAPSRFLELERDAVAGIALGEGSRTSHVSILARAKGLPLVVGLGAIPATQPRDDAVLDAENGRLVLRPSASTRACAKERARKEATERTYLQHVQAQPAVTATGESVAVMINVDHPSILNEAIAAHSDGVGLTRTEFLFENGAPTESEQLAVYRQILSWAGGRSVTIRTLDAGGDKPLPGITRDGESNPFLGMRGVRLSLRNRELFKVQLRAILQAAADNPLKVMVPMVTHPSELEETRVLLREAAEELAREGKQTGQPALGMMIEVPAAALAAEDFDADFYSIGTNDLVQYATACARDNSAVAGLARDDHPGVIRLVEAVVDAGRRRHVEVSVCGDMASDPGGVRRLLDAGIRALSVAPADIGRVKATIRDYRPEDA